MTTTLFRTTEGHAVPAVTATQMRAVDRIAVEEVGLRILQMMENAGRVLARHVSDLRTVEEPVLVVAGNGGNGGGGMVCARHLANREVPVRVVLDRDPEELTDVAAHQHRILDEMGVPAIADVEQFSRYEEPMVVVDALVGYGLTGEVRSPAKEFIERTNHHLGPTISLDVPSGIDATTGDTPGVAVSPDRTVTLALPKIGLETGTGTLYLADIGIPSVVYDRLDIDYRSPFGTLDWVELRT